MTEIFDKNRYNGQVGGCNVSVGRYNNCTVILLRKTKFSTKPDSKKCPQINATLMETGNSNVAIQTGSSYISNIMTDSITIPTANLGFTTRASSQKVSTSVCNIERQPEIVIRSPKTEIVMPLELQQVASKFQRQVPDFRSLLNFWQSIIVAIILAIMVRACRHRKSRISR